MGALTAGGLSATLAPRNAYRNYKANKMYENLPGNVGYDVNGQTYREDGSVTNDFELGNKTQ